MEKLKPCPFCGREGELFSHEAPQALGGGSRYMVVCSGCFGRAGNADTRDGAIKMWNRRSGYETNLMQLNDMKKHGELAKSDERKLESLMELHRKESEKYAQS